MRSSASYDKSVANPDKSRRNPDKSSICYTSSALLDLFLAKGVIAGRMMSACTCRHLSRMPHSALPVECQAPVHILRDICSTPPLHGSEHLFSLHLLVQLVKAYVVWHALRCHIHTEVSQESAELRVLSCHVPDSDPVDWVGGQFDAMQRRNVPQN